LARGVNIYWVREQHRLYGPVVRLGPNELSFIDAQAWKDIYGFQPAGKSENPKDPRFFDFASLEVKSLVNSTDADHARARRIFSKAFSDKALKEQEPLFVKYADLLAEKLREKIEADAKAKIDMVEMLNFTTFDIMGMYLFMCRQSTSNPCSPGMNQAILPSANPSTCLKTQSMCLG
jgi:cytochrome P450